eukprot:TRINITY_DN32416_c0_g1_i1.p1 TRINITY_DN32416_c0_g1~~TRINITY_DN32416_c0_g1_i1.p1  ORF type:complete len:336 (+),score=41.04 TRINITY_DN32416_c0_g1_i1:56-1063(+)
MSSNSRRLDSTTPTSLSDFLFGVQPVEIRDNDGFKLFGTNSVKLGGAPWSKLTSCQKVGRSLKVFGASLCCMSCCPLNCCFGLIVYVKLMFCGTKGQQGTVHMLIHDFIFASPGQHLEVREIDNMSSDVIIPQSFVESGRLNMHTPISLRRSLQGTIDFEMEFGKFSQRVGGDSAEHPRYFLNGGVFPADPALEYTIWTSPARQSSAWGALTVLNEYVDLACCCLLQSSVVLPEDGVLGYITLLQAQNDNFFQRPGGAYYHLTDKKHGEAGVANAEISDPAEQREAEGKVLLRHDHPMASYFGDNDDIDAYIFQEDVAKSCGLVVVHQYRTVVAS